ncbi:DUF1656 domain-containing protein [Pseudaeromonas sp. ZJS20]|uniref:DUF1656 domain-containing protein n=1 Tax=Pseudaeromonas aegiceratis TaxID=3153928 RepID=UPI00390C87BB
MLELDMGGLLLSPLLLAGCLSLLLQPLIPGACYRWLWHPQLARLAVFILTTWGLLRLLQLLPRLFS